MAPSCVFLTFSWEISHNVIILRFCNIVEGQACSKYIMHGGFIMHEKRLKIAKNEVEVLLMWSRLCLKNGFSFGASQVQILFC